MWYLWRTGPGDRAATYVQQFDSLDAVHSNINAWAEGNKVVVRKVSDGIQFIVKSHATTLESLVKATVYHAKRRRETPSVKEIEVCYRRRPIKPGDRLPSPHLKIG